MFDQNRPYSLINIMDNLHGTIKKAQCLKSLEELVQKGDIIEKEYGKTKIYLINQSKFESRTEHELCELENKQNKLENIIIDQGDEIKSIKDDIKKVVSTLDNIKLDNILLNKKLELEKLKETWNNINANEIEPVDDVEFENASNDRLKIEKELRIRKRITLDMIEAIAESSEMKNKEIFDMIGIE